MTRRFSYVSSTQRKLTRRNLGLGLGLGFLCLIVLACIHQPVLVGYAAGQDGAVDPTFKSGSGPNSFVCSVAIQSDGKIIIGGDFTTYNGTARNGITRLNSDGTLDNSFNPGSGARV